MEKPAKRSCEISIRRDFGAWLNKTLSNLTRLWRQPGFMHRVGLDDLRNTLTTGIIPCFTLLYTGEPLNETLMRAVRTAKYSFRISITSFPNKNIYIGALPWESDFWSKSVRMPSSKLTEMYNLDKASEEGLQVPGAKETPFIWRGFGTIPLLGLTGKHLEQRFLIFQVN